MRFAQIPHLIAILTVTLLGANPLSGHADSTQANQSQAEVQKMVFQVSDNDPAKWNLTLNNAFNVQKEFGTPQQSSIEIVAYGPGINMLKFESPVASRIMDALQNGIRVVACQNTMKAQKLTPADMLANIGYVPSGVGELVKKQHEGYAYIRP
jgi:hypothetical protein